MAMSIPHLSLIGVGEGQALRENRANPSPALSLQGTLGQAFNIFVP